MLAAPPIGIHPIELFYFYYIIMESKKPEAHSFYFISMIYFIIEIILLSPNCAGPTQFSIGSARRVFRKNRTAYAFMRNSTHLDRKSAHTNAWTLATGARRRANAAPRRREGQQGHSLLDYTRDQMLRTT